MKEFDLETLAESDGKEGRPALVAYQGKVYDVSQSKLWPSGQHMKRHPAGKDLTADISAAPHGPENLDRFPQVGVLKKESTATRPMPFYLEKLLSRYPILRRHPHPMLVHFPIALFLLAPLFGLLYLLFDVRSFEITAFHCLGGGIIFAIPAAATGLFTWWLNYLAKPMRPVTIKIRFTIILWLASIGAFIWRILAQDILTSLTGWGLIYFLLLLSFIPMVTVIGWFGAQLTFPLEKDRH
jgi:predicted heme/steroid binding protein/uncharacterized membrane protein